MEFYRQASKAKCTSGKDLMDYELNISDNLRENNEIKEQMIESMLHSPKLHNHKSLNYSQFEDCFGSSPYNIPNYHKISISGEESVTLALEEIEEKVSALVDAIELRKYYMRSSCQNGNVVSDNHVSNYKQLIGRSQVTCMKDLLSLSEVVFIKGVANFSRNSSNSETDLCNISLKQFCDDFYAICALVSDGPLKSFCFRRLNFLKTKFQMHRMLNELNESAELKSTSHRDFYNIMKVDTHIHAAAAMNQKHLQRFIKKSLNKHGHREVMKDKKSGKILTLSEVFNSLGLSPDDLNIDKLDMHCDRNTFHRFDVFNNKYNPAGEAQLRDIFLKTNNFNEGKLFAEVMREVIDEIEESKYISIEPRLSVYGTSKDEWDKLAKWADNNNMYSDNVKWMIQVPRIYDIFKRNKLVQSYAEILENLFLPLFEVTLNPDSHPELHRFLQNVSGFDSVDDESKPESCLLNEYMSTPDKWSCETNPPYAYYLYYMFVNLSILNKLRKSRGLNTFSFRPHCGESGSTHHLVASFLLAESINHGLLLRKAPVIQYLFYLCQIGVAMSPLSNNSLFLEYQKNPIFDYFSCGLNVSLSTDDPLQFHYTREPLMEEYSIAAQIWKLSSTDMCELARNSVLMSGFSDDWKARYIGNNFKQEGVKGNDIKKTNVPTNRIAFRHDTLIQELILLWKMASDSNTV